MAIFAIYRRILDVITRIVWVVSCLIMASLVIMAGWQVWGRYVLNNTPTWTEQTTLLLLVYIVLPLAAVGVREGFHLAVEVVPEMVSKTQRIWLDRIVSLCLGGFGVAMASGGWELMARTATHRVPLIEISRSFTYLPLFLCGVLTVLFVVERLVDSFYPPAEPVHPESK